MLLLCNINKVVDKNNNFPKKALFSNSRRCTGWESQLLETGFLAIWLVPVFSIQLLPVNTPTSRLCIYGYRWLIFRIMIGAGLIKVGHRFSFLDVPSKVSGVKSARFKATLFQ